MTPMVPVSTIVCVDRTTWAVSSTTPEGSSG
ncbi:hypothetical protein JOF41_004772 [Saccharothrix coeruleofusca]|nr:hypothetical protein [Saccharothrix coeruleofusca]